MGPEAKIRAKIRRYLQKIPQEELFFWSQVAHPRMRKGLPDFSLVYRGLYVGLEVKAGRNQPTENQRHTMERIRKAGGIAEVVRSVAEVKKVLGDIKN